MRRGDWSAVAHRGLEPMGPYDLGHLDRALAQLEGVHGARVADLGCGSGYVLAHLAETYGVTGVGVDIRPPTVRVPGVEFVQSDAETFEASQAFDLALSIGAVSGPERLAGLVRKGGAVIWGTGYWLQEPGKDYLGALGAARDEMADLAGTVQAGRRAGLEPLEPVLSSTADWDRYEDAWYANGAGYAEQHSQEPGMEEFAAWIEGGRRRYRELGGRETLGFGLFPFRRASAPAD